jgi:hypothetical protein
VTSEPLTTDGDQANRIGVANIVKWENSAVNRRNVIE